MNRIPTFRVSVPLREIKWGCYLLFSLCIALLFFTCSSPTPKEKELYQSLDTPEQVAKKWQELVYRNQFEEARALSTQNAKDWITWIEKMVVGENTLDEETEMPIYLEMKCKEKGSKATCAYLMKEGSELYRDSFMLVKVKNQWLVDIPEEDLEVDESMEKMLKEMEEILKEPDSQ